jgi:hypothetical protein
MYIKQVRNPNDKLKLTQQLIDCRQKIMNLHNLHLRKLTKLRSQSSR